jgi:hypothetical protein|tara:strand:- start:1029 stop:1406 length:378 start_codon:yes stop_codon:yes gene_type:complete
LTAVTTIRPAAGNVFFTTETQESIATVTGSHRYSCFIDKVHTQTPYPVKQKTPLEQLRGSWLKRRSLASSLSQDTHGLSTLRALNLKLDLTFDQSKQRVIFTKAYIITRMKSGTALSDDDVSRFN